MGWWENLVESLTAYFGGDRLNVQRRFETLDKVHSGKQSVLLRVKDKKTGTIHLLKISDPKQTDDYESRFAKLGKPREGEIALKFKHPSILEASEQGLTAGGEPYIVMENFEGRTLQTVTQYYNHELEGKRLAIIKQLAGALAAVHQEQFIHRDFCLENFMVSNDCQTIKLMDFTFTVPQGSQYLTTDRRTGREDYMAPELMKPQEADYRLDIFALGVAAYHVCTGQLPWGAAMGTTSIARAMRTPTDIKKHRPQIAPSLAMAIHSCLIAKPAERCPSAADFLSRIQSLTHEDLPLANRA